MVAPHGHSGEGAYGVSMLANLALAGAKLAVGFLASSPVLVADGWHSLSDVAMNALAWAGHRASLPPPDDDHHYGHGNWEALVGFFVGLIVLAAGAGVVVSVFRSSDRGTDPERGALALSVGVLAGLAKLVLAIYTARVGNRLHSLSLIAVSRDNLADAMVGALVPVSIGATLLGFSWAEPAAAVAIGAVIARMGIASTREGLDVLMDRAPAPDLRPRLEQIASAVAGVNGVQNVRIHPLGSSLRVDMEINVDGALSVAEGHRIAHAVENAVVASEARVVEVHVHVNPTEKLPAGPGSRVAP